MEFGFVITKAPVESGLVAGILKVALSAMESGKQVNLFLISDGVWLAKKEQKNQAATLFNELLVKGANVTVSEEHLIGAGIEEGEIVNGLGITRKTYKSLVGYVMEDWDKVVVI